MNVVEPIRCKEDVRKIESILAKQNKRNLLFFTLGVNSGLRISDILALDIKDVKDKTHIDIVEQKTGKHKRFPVNDKIRLLIKEVVKNRDEKEPLFKTKFRNRLGRVRAYTIINEVCKEAGIDYKVGTHTLRKTFGYHHYRQFKDLAILQKIFNHSDPSVTLRYIGIEQDTIEESYKKFVL